MNIIHRLKPFLFFIPFSLILLVGCFLKVYPDAKQMKIYRNNLYSLITEKDLKVLLQKAKIEKTSVFKFQMIRLSISLITFVLFVLLKRSVKGVLVSLIIAFIVYKYFYIYLINLENRRIKRLNKELPYDVKTIVYLSHIYPVTNSLEKAIFYVSDSFREDIKQLVNDIDLQPNGYVPYQNFIDRYDGKLNDLDFYLRVLYRLNVSSNNEEKLLESLNSAISSEIKRVRKMKNDSVNSTIQYLGMLPVGFVTAMLTYVLVVVSKTI